ncbi:MAG TPA: manganese efflux pump MntP family protein [Candidatus Hydrogenedentes bacterium]|nr:manganese efflux pump MntP family protein [Candidatus Hydrogenedentota bacterium]HOR50558.1 manganese efflux pump MntP family protein [Candidatus Hydrogenedentota bacterium]HPX86128.1 manganese efflux pump MntP family protein [Candidatus Hydrogenedentota bacterium]HQB03739.1 manganese efflux pump MntP family protein [Candidatus Hydrogenedentota bacterium]
MVYFQFTAGEDCFFLEAPVWDYSKLGLLEIGILGLGLSIDAFAVAMVASTLLVTVNRRQFFRLSFHFGLFQALMPLIGWLAGQTVEKWIHPWDHWVIFLILLAVGGKMSWEAWSSYRNGTDPLASCSTDPTRGLRLIGLSIATSLDALAVGLTLAVMQVNIFFVVFVIGCITASLTFTGMKLGSRLGLHFGQKVQIFGGFLLAALGMKVLLAHFLS